MLTFLLQTALWLVIFCSGSGSEALELAEPSAAELEKVQSVEEKSPFIRAATEAMDRTPYVPRLRDYSVELGSFWEEQSHYWVAGHFGFHLGLCPWTGWGGCQSYWDVLVGFAGHDRDSITQALVGPRWQIVNFPSSWSPFVRLLAGVAWSEGIGQGRNSKPSAALALGFARYLHKRMDVRFEVRGGVVTKPYVQVGLGLQLKVDEWVDFFADKIRGLGEQTVDIISAPFRSEEPPQPE